MSASFLPPERPAIFLDSCISRRIFEELGPDEELDFCHVRDVFKRKDTYGNDKSYDPGDALILRYATLNKRIIVTRDSDFKTLAVHHQKNNAGIIWLKGVQSPTDMFLHTLEILDQYGDQIKEGRIAVFEKDTVSLMDTPMLEKRQARQQQMAQKKRRPLTPQGPRL